MADPKRLATQTIDHRLTAQKIMFSIHIIVREYKSNSFEFIRSSRFIDNILMSVVYNEVYPVLYVVCFSLLISSQ